jgi:hypothetical protein
LVNAASRGAVGAVSAQVTQAAGSLALQSLTALFLGFAGLGRFAVLFGLIVLLTALVSGFVGDSLTVLDRNHPLVRAALEGWALGLIAVVSVGSAAVCALIGLVSPGEAAIFAAAAAAFVAEDLIRRLHMAEFLFWRIVAMDASAALVTVGVLVLTPADSRSLALVLAALAAGQLVGLAAGILLLPSSQRRLVRITRGRFGSVAALGTWRSASQALRPAMLTAVRTTAVLAAGFAATGGLEAARIYVAPTMLLIGGVSSWLFADYARRPEVALGGLVRRADRSVISLVAGTILVGAAAIAALPLAGPLLVGHPIGLTAVVGWLAFSATVAAVTPYGSLAAVRGRQAVVFGVRLADSVASVVGVILLVALGGAIVFAPAILALCSLCGGLAIRFLVLSAPLPEAVPVVEPTIPKGEMSRVHSN